jgi:nucleoside-diphosphate-sugar epimerase
MIKIALKDNAYGEVYNVGSGVPISFIELAKKIVAISGKGEIDYTEFTSERKALEPGDYFADISKIKKTIDWTPKVRLDEGIDKTIKYYKKFKEHYW